MHTQWHHIRPVFFGLVFFLSCKEQSTTPAIEAINAMDLKRGEAVACGPSGKEFGTVRFITSCSPKTKTDFDLAVALLHSFEYDEAEKMFARVINVDPSCAMAYWGVAMSNYHQVWIAPPTPAELEKASKAIAIAQSLPTASKIETDYINAIAVYYNDWKTKDHRTRSLDFVKAMENLHATYPADKEAAVFYALSLVGAADPADKTFANQKKAGEILNALYPGEPNHPGIVHYIIHSYDSPELAGLALPAARKYAAIAPSSAHAQHMPSHIFTRLGLWDEAIPSNRVAVSSAKCYAGQAGIKGHWDEELHAMDYLVYAHLQKGENGLAKQQCDYLKNMRTVSPVNFKVAYAFAAIPARYFLENRLWAAAAGMEVHPSFVSWEAFPWQKAIIHFTRLLGAVHANNLNGARAELAALKTIHDTLSAQKDAYKAAQVMIQLKTGEAWIRLGEGKPEEALQLMEAAAGMEDITEKAAVTPGEVLPAQELLGDMLLQLNRPAEALSAYEADLKKHANRFNGLHGAAVASERANNAEKANYYYRQLIAIANSPEATRSELQAARLFLAKQH